MLLPADSVFNLVRCAWKKLCRNNYILTLCEIPERTSDKLLTCASLIGNRRIIEIHAKIKPLLDDLSGIEVVLYGYLEDMASPQWRLKDSAIMHTVRR